MVILNQPIACALKKPILGCYNFIYYKLEKNFYPNKDVQNIPLKLIQFFLAQQFDNLVYTVSSIKPNIIAQKTVKNKFEGVREAFLKNVAESRNAKIENDLAIKKKVESDLYFENLCREFNNTFIKEGKKIIEPKPKVDQKHANAIKEERPVRRMFGPKINNTRVSLERKAKRPRPPEVVFPNHDDDDDDDNKFYIFLDNLIRNFKHFFSNILENILENKMLYFCLTSLISISIYMYINRKTLRKTAKETKEKIKNNFIRFKKAILYIYNNDTNL